MSLEIPTPEPVPVTDAGYRQYRRNLWPQTDRQLDAFAALETLLDEGRFVVDNGTLRDRFAETTDGSGNLRSVAVDLYRSGAASAVSLCDARGGAKLLHPAVVWEVGPGCPTEGPGAAPVGRERSARVQRYLGAYDRQHGLADAASDEASAAARQAWLYATLREHAEPVDGDQPRVGVSFRRLGSVDADDGERFPFPDYLFDVSAAFGQWGVLATLRYDGLRVAEPPQLADALRQELLGYHAAAVCAHESAPREHLNRAWTADPAGAGNVTARTPFLAHDVTVDTEARVVQLASLYQRRTRT